MATNTQNHQNQNILVLPSYCFKFPQFENRSGVNSKDRYNLPSIVQRQRHESSKKATKAAHSKSKPQTYKDPLSDHRKSFPRVNEPVRESLKRLQNYLPRQEKYLYEENFRQSKFKIAKNERTICELKDLMRGFIEKQRISNFQTIIDAPNACMNLGKMSFVEDFLPDQKRMKFKYGWPRPNIERNKLQLEHILLTRLEKYSDRNFQELNDEVLVSKVEET